MMEEKKDGLIKKDVEICYKQVKVNEKFGFLDIQIF